LVQRDSLGDIYIPKHMQIVTLLYISQVAPVLSPSASNGYNLFKTYCSFQPAMNFRSVTATRNLKGVNFSTSEASLYEISLLYSK